MAVDRIPFFEALVWANPADGRGQTSVRDEHRAAGRARDALRELARLGERIDGDEGAARISLAKARGEATEVVGARDALRFRPACAAAPLHRAVLGAEEARVARCSEAPSA